MYILVRSVCVCSVLVERTCVFCTLRKDICVLLREHMYRRVQSDALPASSIKKTCTVLKHRSTSTLNAHWNVHFTFAARTSGC